MIGMAKELRVPDHVLDCDPLHGAANQDHLPVPWYHEKVAGEEAGILVHALIDEKLPSWARVLPLLSENEIDA